MKALPFFLFVFIYPFELPDHVTEMYALDYKWQLRIENDLASKRENNTVNRRVTVYCDPIDDSELMVEVEFDSTGHSLFRKRFFVVDKDIRFIETARVDTSGFKKSNPKPFLWEIEAQFISEKGECSIEVASCFIDSYVPSKEDSSTFNCIELKGDYDLEKSLCSEILEKNRWVFSHLK